MDCLNLYEENIEYFPAVSTSYHNEVIVWWCILFIILKLIFFPSVLGINELLFPSQVSCCDFEYPEHLEAPPSQLPGEMS